jgi:gliding motility-associated-like protein
MRIIVVASTKSEFSKLSKAFVKGYCLTILLLMCVVFAKAQCPPNIGFEEGNFNHWECSIGKVDSSGTINVIPSQPSGGRHTLYSSSSAGEMDFYGEFPVNCPNGSGYSIKLGNEEIGAQAERVSYTFVIPLGQDEFSLIYHYAVVFQNPSHEPYQQPRFTAKVFDVTSGKYIDCSSFDYAASGNLPGFKNVSGTDVFYKPWSPVTIKLAGYAGKTIRLEFTTNDCTKGGHFGYAYLDIDEDCTTPIKGNTFCIGTSSLTLVAPFGYQEYRWHDSAFNSLLGTSSTLKLSPTPSPGTKYALEVFPYPGSGCIDTLYSTIAYAPVQVDFHLQSSLYSCAPATLDITDPQLRQGSSVGLHYNYYLDSLCTAYIPAPSKINTTGLYYIQAKNTYGCKDIKTIQAVITGPPKFSLATPVRTYWPNTVDITKTSLITGNVQGINFSYWKDAAATALLSDAQQVSVSGTYFIKATNTAGCSSVQPIQVLITPPPPANAFSPNKDGINDSWEINGLQTYPECTVDIYNRWGQLMYHSVGYKKPWNGTSNGHELPMDTYYYVIHLSAEAGYMKGCVTLIR